MDQICLVVPVLPGRTADARDFMRELEADRKAGYQDSEQRIGIVKEAWYLAHTPAGDHLVAYMESPDFPTGEPYSTADSIDARDQTICGCINPRVHGRRRPAARHADVSCRLPRWHRFNSLDLRILHMLDPHFVIFGAAISLIGIGVYAIDTLRGRVKPNRVSWTLWALAPLIAFAAERAGGVGWQSLTTLAPGVGPLLVLIASAFNRQSYWQVTRFDLTCGGLSVLALALWAATSSGNLAILLSILADGLASVPTLIKSCREPATESHWPYLATAVNGAMALLTITRWQFTEYAFPAYLTLMFAAISELIMFPHLRFRKAPA